MQGKLAAYRQILSTITMQPVAWIDTSAFAATNRRRTLLREQQVAPIQLLSQVHALADQLTDVGSRLAASVADGSLYQQLQGIGLELVNGSVWTQASASGAPVAPAQGAPLTQSSPAPAPSSSSSASSSVPIGAIVGGVAGGIAVLAVIGFFALRPHKGWLRHKKTPQWDIDGPATAPHMPLEIDTFINYKDPSISEQAAIPQISSDTSGHLPRVPSAAARSGLGSASPLTPARTASRGISVSSLDTDPVLSYISSSLASMPPERLARVRNSSAATTEALEQWLVQWEAIKLERPIGRGSAGWVYCARYNETPVAVKTL